MKIRLNDSSDATKIVSIANKYKNCDIDAKVGRYVIDMKSILGVLSFGLPKEMEVNVLGPTKEVDAFYDEIGYWRV